MMQRSFRGSGYLDRPHRGLQEACEDAGRAWLADGRRYCPDCPLFTVCQSDRKIAIDPAPNPLATASAT